jgi:hypothetical protein
LVWFEGGKGDLHFFRTITKEAHVFLPEVAGDLRLLSVYVARVSLEDI